MPSPYKILFALTLGLASALAWAEEEKSMAKNIRLYTGDASCSISPYGQSDIELQKVGLPTKIRWASAILFPGLAKEELGILVYDPEYFVSKIEFGQNIEVLVVDHSVDNKEKSFFAQLICHKKPDENSASSNETSSSDGSTNQSTQGDMYSLTGDVNKFLPNLDDYRGFSARGLGLDRRKSELFRYKGTSEDWLENLKPDTYKSGRMSLSSGSSAPRLHNIQ